MKNKIMTSPDREFEGSVIKQMIGGQGNLCATDMLRAYETTRTTQQKPGWVQKDIKEYFRSHENYEFMIALCNELNINVNNIESIADYHTTRATRDNNKASWFDVAKEAGLVVEKKKEIYMNPYLFVGFAMWLNPEFRAKVIIWVADSLIMNRLEAGYQYKPMTQAVQKYLEPSYEPKFAGDNAYIHEAILINQIVFGFHEKEIRQKATAEQLKLLEKIEIKNTVLILAGVSEDKRKEVLLESLKDLT